MCCYGGVYCAEGMQTRRRPQASNAQWHRESEIAKRNLRFIKILYLGASYWLLTHAVWIWLERAWGVMQMYVKWPLREMKHWHRCLHLFLPNNIYGDLFIVLKNIKSKNACPSNCMVVQFQIVETIDNSISYRASQVLTSFGEPFRTRICMTGRVA